MFLSYAKLHTKWYPLFLLALATGMRQGELLALRWEDVDWQRGMCRVAQALCWPNWPRRSGPILVVPKSEKSRRVITVDAETMNVLRHHQRKQTDERLTHPPQPECRNVVFVTVNGKRMDPRSFLQPLFKQLATKAGSPRSGFTICVTPTPRCCCAAAVT